MDARSNPLLSGIELPRGARLTKARLEVLQYLGAVLLNNERPELRRGRSYGSRYGIRSLYPHPYSLSTSAKAALRGMFRAKWLFRDESTTAYVMPMQFQPPWAQIAKRLAAQQAMGEEATKQRLDGPQKRREAARGAVWSAWAAFENVAKQEPPSMVAMVDAWEAWRAAKREDAAADAEWERVQQAEVEHLPSPREAITWLVRRELVRANGSSD